jgi:hypothetical protein
MEKRHFLDPIFNVPKLLKDYGGGRKRFVFENSKQVVGYVED